MRSPSDARPPTIVDVSSYVGIDLEFTAILRFHVV